ncbi:MAG: TetR/AcrR family transcriptional regulator [Myxococcota bacterium]
MDFAIQDEAGHSPRVTRKRQARLQQIVRSALAIVREEGREALTLQRLADALGVTAASLYRYFPSKDALVAELQRSTIAWLGRETRARIAAATRDPAAAATPPDLLAVVVSAFAFESFARTSPVEFGLLTMHLSAPEYGLPDAEAARVFQTAWESLSDLAGHLDGAARCGALAPGDAAERAVTLFAGLQGVVQTRKLARSAPDRIDPGAIARALVPTLLVGWGGEPECVATAVDLTLEHRFAEPEGCVEDLLGADAA